MTKNIYMGVLAANIVGSLALNHTKKDKIAGVDIKTLKAINLVLILGSLTGYIVMSLRHKKA